MSKDSESSGRGKEEFPAFEIRSVPEKSVGPVFWFMITGIVGWWLGMYFRSFSW